MAVATLLKGKQVDQAPQPARVPERAPAEAENLPSLQEFLHDNGLTNWSQSDEGRYYLLHVCMVRGRAAA